MTNNLKSCKRDQWRCSNFRFGIFKLRRQESFAKNMENTEIITLHYGEMIQHAGRSCHGFLLVTRRCKWIL